jgi:2,4-dienoyl-CoA reductase-like NADH-dependent reductase (Old Yellow Enzyme family)
MSTMSSGLFGPVRLGPITLRNRVIKAATYENAARRGEVTDRLVDFHVRHARGGVGMTTVAYCAVAPEGRTDGHQIVWREEARPGLVRLTDAVHAEGAAISAQIGHSGPVGDPRATKMKALSPTPYFNPQAFTRTKQASKGDLERIVAQHGAAAAMAVEVGFDAVEVHIGHNYLASSFLSPKLNKRKDEYGGSLENRARVARDSLRAVRDAVGDRIAIIAKMNMTDGVPGGLWLDESLQVASWIEQDGSVDALEMTEGSSLLNPMYLFRGEAPIAEFAKAVGEPVGTAVRLVGKRFLREYPYEDLYLLEHARQVRAAVRLPMVLLGGVTSAAGVRTAVEHGFEFVAMGRALLREPDLVARMVAGSEDRSLCIHCNRCMATIYGGTRCVLTEPPQSWAAASGENT